MASTYEKMKREAIAQQSAKYISLAIERLLLCMFIFFNRIVVVEVPDLLSSIDYRALTPDANEKRPDIDRSFEITTCECWTK